MLVPMPASVSRWIALRISDNLALGGGLRWTQIDKTGEVQGTTTNFLPGPPGTPNQIIPLNLLRGEIGGFLNVIAYTTYYQDLRRSALDIDIAQFITSIAAGARTRGVEMEAGFSQTPQMSPRG